MGKHILVVDDSVTMRQMISFTLTGAGFEVKEGRAAGATGWIVKPFHPEQLLNVIRKVLLS